MKGSVLVVDFEDREELDTYLNKEPYILKDVWEKVEIHPMMSLFWMERRLGNGLSKYLRS